MYRNTYDDNHISCDWGIPYEIDNTNKGYFPSTPEKFNRGVYRDEEGNLHYAALNPDNRPLGNIFGISESLIDKLDIREGEKDKSVLKKKIKNENGIIL